MTKTTAFFLTLFAVAVCSGGHLAAFAQHNSPTIIIPGGGTASTIGGMTFGTTDDGGSFTINRIGGTTFYDGTTGDGEFYSGSCFGNGEFQQCF